jgi:hypothetical protein
MYATLIQPSTSQHLTATEKDRAARHLAQSRTSVVHVVRGLTQAQWDFKAAPERWSIAEILEHVALVEEMFLDRVVPRLCAGPLCALDNEPQATDRLILFFPTDGSTTFAAPPPVLPAGRGTPAESLDRFLAGRKATCAFLESPGIGLRQHRVDHLMFGPLDGYQWVLFMAAHTQRHVKQILAVKIHPGLPLEEF